MTPVSFRIVYAAGLLIGLVALSGCSSGNNDSDRAIVILISGADGETPGHYVVAVDYHNERRVRVSCPSGEGSTPNIECVESGLLIRDGSANITATVKSRGYHFTTDSFDTASLPQLDGSPTFAVQLAALSEFEDNDDFTTGYDDPGGLERFVEMSRFADTEMGPTRSVKFYIGDIQSSPKVYFINTVKHVLHYDFVHEVLGVDLLRAEYDDVTYRGEDRTGMAGTIILFESASAWSEALGLEAVAPIAVTFFPTDNLSPTMAAKAHRLVEERLAFAPLDGEEHRAVYLPAGENQERDLTEDKPLLRRLDAPWMHRDELYGNVTLQILNPGIAYGTLVRLSPEELEKRIVSYNDILVLTRLPNDLPIVGGTITEELQTPLSHVNLASLARGTPNIALLGAAEDERVADHLGRLVRFEVSEGSFRIDEATLSEAMSFWQSRTPEPVVPEVDLELTGLPGFEELDFFDSVRVGAKAANLAQIWKVLGEKAPYGFAVPFYYYDEFMHEAIVTTPLCDEAKTDCLGEGRDESVCEQARQICGAAAAEQLTLWQYAAELVADELVKSDSVLREAALDGLRYLIRHIEIDAEFADALNDRIVEVFGESKARLRSSTNAEDLPTFSGAGLYDSVSAYGSGEVKIASSQIRKVWASVWNWRAFEERSFWNIDHLAVRMGVAVNQAFPDEAANGVIITQNIADQAVRGMYVNVQLGEEPVTNPEGGALPEVFSIVPAPSFNLQVARYRYSSLSPDQPILSETETMDLYAAAYKLVVYFAPLYQQSPLWLALDLEFKFHGPQRDLYIKQARPYVRALDHAD